MRFYFGIIFGFLLGLTIENSFGAEHIMVDQLVPVVTNTKSLAKEVKPQEKEDMSKETAEKMLEALQQQEKELQEKLQKKKVKGKKVKVLKDW